MAAHFHDTFDTAVANILVALEVIILKLINLKQFYINHKNQYGIQTVDSSVGGLGGCPYAKI